MPCVGSWDSQNIRRMSTNDTSLGLYTTRTPSVCPVMPEQALAVAVGTAVAVPAGGGTTTAAG